MQIKYLHKSVYRVRGIDETEYSPEVYQRLHAIETHKKLTAQQCSEQVILEALQMSRATLYRWRQRYKARGLAGLANDSRRPNRLRVPLWSHELEQLVFKLRKKHPMYGKYKITVLLKRECLRTISVSSVGRIIRIFLKRKAVKPVRFYFGHARGKKKRLFTGHAQRWQYGMRAKQLGDMVELDHMVLLLAPGFCIRHFKAICPITKIIVCQAYTCATSNIAADFLKRLIAQFPFKVRSIKVDGGSEFMGEFERACRRYGIALYVLPPRSPKYNGHVERGHCTVKYEFYEQYEGLPLLGIIRFKLKEYVDKYNRKRPHQALQYLTPLEYYYSLGAQSHMY
jgi:transposase